PCRPARASSPFPGSGLPCSPTPTSSTRRTPTPPSPNQPPEDPTLTSNYPGKPQTSIEEAVLRLAEADPERDGGSFAALDPSLARDALANLERETAGGCGTCDGSGVLFTQPV